MVRFWPLLLSSGGSKASNRSSIPDPKWVAPVGGLHWWKTFILSKYVGPLVPPVPWVCIMAICCCHMWWQTGPMSAVATYVRCQHVVMPPASLSIHHDVKIFTLNWFIELWHWDGMSLRNTCRLQSRRTKLFSIFSQRMSDCNRTIQTDTITPKTASKRSKSSVAKRWNKQQLETRHDPRHRQTHTHTTLKQDHGVTCFTAPHRREGNEQLFGMKDRCRIFIIQLVQLVQITLFDFELWDKEEEEECEDGKPKERPDRNSPRE